MSEVKAEKEMIARKEAERKSIQGVKTLKPRKREREKERGTPMERGKERADLRTGDLKRLIGELEHHRDILMGEVAKNRERLK